MFNLNNFLKSLAVKAMNYIREKTEERDSTSFIKEAQGIMKVYPDMMIIVGDPKTDTIALGYKKMIISANIVGTDGKDKNMQVINTILNCTNENRFDRKIDKLLLFIDGALFQLANKIKGRNQK